MKTTEDQNGASLKRMVSRHPTHWMISPDVCDSEGNRPVWLIRHKPTRASEPPITEHEILINFLCEQLMSANEKGQP